jgi:hypothetical protein
MYVYTLTYNNLGKKAVILLIDVYSCLLFVMGYRETRKPVTTKRGVAKDRYLGTPTPQAYPS